MKTIFKPRALPERRLAKWFVWATMPSHHHHHHHCCHCHCYVLDGGGGGTPPPCGTNAQFTDPLPRQLANIAAPTSSNKVASIVHNALPCGKCLNYGFLLTHAASTLISALFPIAIADSVVGKICFSSICMWCFCVSRFAAVTERKCGVLLLANLCVFAYSRTTQRWWIILWRTAIEQSSAKSNDSPRLIKTPWTRLPSWLGSVTLCRFLTALVLGILQSFVQEQNCRMVCTNRTLSDCCPGETPFTRAKLSVSELLVRVKFDKLPGKFVHCKHPFAWKPNDRTFKASSLDQKNRTRTQHAKEFLVQLCYVTSKPAVILSVFLHSCI